jgi:hypothetical protein
MQLKNAIAQQLSTWIPTDKHMYFAQYCSCREIPILTTNYDLNFEYAFELLKHLDYAQIKTTNSELLSKTVRKLFEKHGINSKLVRFYHNKAKGIDPEYRRSEVIPDSDTFLWKYYYSAQKRSDVRESELNQASVRHIHGMIKKPRSIRVGLNDYVSLLSKLKQYKASRYLNSDKTHKTMYDLTYSWMDYFFTSDLVIFGLGLNQSEIGLRWLLMERCRFAKISETDLRTIFIFGKNGKGVSKLLKSIGVTCILDSDHSIYDYFKEQAILNEV